MGGGGGCLTGHKKRRQPSSGDLGVGLCPGRDGVLLIYEPLCTLVNKNKTAGVITNSLLTGSIIYERREEVLQAPWFPLVSRADQSRDDAVRSQALGAPTASPARARCTVPWVQGRKNKRTGGQMSRGGESSPPLLCDQHPYEFLL